MSSTSEDSFKSLTTTSPSASPQRLPQLDSSLDSEQKKDEESFFSHYIDRLFRRQSLENPEFVKKFLAKHQSFATIDTLQNCMYNLFLEKPWLLNNAINGNTNLLQNLPNNPNLTQKLTSNFLAPEFTSNPTGVQQALKSFSNVSNQNRPNVFSHNRILSEPYEMVKMVEFQKTYKYFENELGIKVSNLTIDELYRNFVRRTGTSNSFRQVNSENHRENHISKIKQNEAKFDDLFLD